MDLTSDLTSARASAALQAVGLTEPVTRVQPLDGGVSNLTWRIARGAAAAAVLRVQREQGIFEPYDVVREARVLEALADSVIPVPRVLGLASDGDLLGAPFFVTEYIDAPHMGLAPRSAWPRPEGTQDSYVRTVAAIHGLDWRATGLDFLDPSPPGPEAARRDLATVMGRAHRYGLDAIRFIAETATWLGAHLPRTAEPALSQGDINVYNYLVREGEVVAVVDWEQAQIGDSALRPGVTGGAALRARGDGGAGVVAADCPLRANQRPGPPCSALFHSGWATQVGGDSRHLDRAVAGPALVRLGGCGAERHRAARNDGRRTGRDRLRLPYADGGKRMRAAPRLDADGFTHHRRRDAKTCNSSVPLSPNLRMMLALCWATVWG